MESQPSRPDNMSKHKKEELTKRKRKELVVAIGMALTLAFVFLGLLPRLKTDGNSVGLERKSNETREVIGRHPLTGMPVYEDIGFPQVYGVMIDNHADARPQAGLDMAFLVFEAPVEAGIPRMLAFFYYGQDIEKIGPVRSARPYYLDWNNELSALYAHVGGSDAALDLIASGGTFDFNQYWNDGFFWRAYNRYAPHNVYTSSELMGDFVKRRRAQNKVADPLYETWKFRDPDFSSQMETDRVELSFYPPEYVAAWHYNNLTHRYLRFQADLAHTMEDGTQIMADNIAVVISDVKILDSVGRRRIRTIGEGEAVVFLDGRKIEGTWKKQTQSSRLRFYDAQDAEIAFNAGVTWVEVIADRDDLSVK